MAKQFHVGRPPATADAAEEFAKSLELQINELEEQLKLLRSVKAAIRATFPPADAWLGAAITDAADA